MTGAGPDFGSPQYERPNRNWICGKACEGKPCRLGPDAKGRCRVTFECQPAFKTNPGEAKGRYYCMRPAEFGGPCSGGPLPDGTCAHPLAKCAPVRSLRAKRKILTLGTIILTTGLLLAGLCGPYRWRFISPGELSAPHATVNNCGSCHGAARGGLLTWADAALAAKPGPFQFHSLLVSDDLHMTAIDRNCLVCHPNQSFHEPNVVSEHSCSGCHVEHQGPALMRPTDASCLSCHANAQVMAASAALGETLPAGAFHFHPNQGRVIFDAPRPKQGFTQVMHSFAADHPEFEVISDHLKGSDTLKFNHELHLTPSRVTWQGRKLECGDCHKPDAAGVYHLKITYEENCRMCHSNQFDIHNPGLLIPHGPAVNVRAFLRTLPQQYADYAARTNGMAAHDRNQAFAQEQIKLLRADFGSGEELERNVFFNEKSFGPASRIGGAGGAGPALFPGCAYCHQVKPTANGAPEIVPTVIPDRWLVHGNFDHSKHLQSIPNLPKLDCAFCHDAAHSRDASDILLPSQKTCAICHSPAGGVASSCSTCHGYHSPKATDFAETWHKAIASRDK